MNAFASKLTMGCLALVAASAYGADEMKKDGMAKDAMGKSAMTMQQCKDHMAMAAKPGMKKDDAMMKKDAMCADMMMKKDGATMRSDGMAKPGSMASQPGSK